MRLGGDRKLAIRLLLTEFQFQLGAIGSSKSSGIFKGITRFNSSLVRLGAEYLLKTLKNLCQFQFQLGAIGRIK